MQLQDSAFESVEPRGTLQHDCVSTLIYQCQISHTAAPSVRQWKGYLAGRVCGATKSEVAFTRNSRSFAESGPSSLHLRQVNLFAKVFRTCTNSNQGLRSRFLTNTRPVGWKARSSSAATGPAPPMHHKHAVSARTCSTYCSVKCRRADW